jgi:hypothetical protein
VKTNERVQSKTEQPDPKNGKINTRYKQPDFGPFDNSLVANILHLQQTIGNNTVKRLLISDVLQSIPNPEHPDLTRQTCRPPENKAPLNIIQPQILINTTGVSNPADIMTDAQVQAYVDDIGVGNLEFKDIIDATGKEYSFIAGNTDADRKAYRKKLITGIIWDMHKATTVLYYISQPEMVTEIRKRAVTSLDMRASQGKTSGLKPTGYPPKTANSWAAIAGTEAAPYWVVTIVPGDYNFTLSDPLGKNNAYTALMKLLFVHQSSQQARSLMHCDYLISAIHFKVMAEAMGTDVFNEEVRQGNIQIILQDLSISDITQKASESEPNKSLQEVELDSEAELIIGDHVIFYNHPAYDYLNNNIHQSWRLENAIVIDNEGPGNSKRFQGHGYFSPLTKAQFIDQMKDKFNTLVKKAQSMVSANNQAGLARDFSYTDGGVVFKAVDYDLVGGRIANPRIKYQEGGNDQELPLRELTAADYTQPFIQPGASKISVYRPMESRPNSN